MSKLETDGIDRARACLFTGHRELPREREELEALQRKTAQAIAQAYEKGYRTFYAGGAVGFDMLSSVELLNARIKDLPEAKLILVLPHFRHYVKWGGHDRTLFSEILRRADGVVYIEKEYTPGCMQRRNRYMVDRASLCICYLKKRSGGTAFTVNCAVKAGLTVVNLANGGGECGEQQSFPDEA